jgi:hypothetical protein
VSAAVRNGEGKNDDVVQTTSRTESEVELDVEVEDDEEDGKDRVFNRLVNRDAYSRAKATKMRSMGFKEHMVKEAVIAEAKRRGLKMEQLLGKQEQLSSEQRGDAVLKEEDLRSRYDDEENLQSTANRMVSATIDSEQNN